MPTLSETYNLDKRKAKTLADTYGIGKSTANRPTTSGNKFLRVTMADLPIPTSKAKPIYPEGERPKPVQYGSSGFTKQLENSISRLWATNPPADAGVAVKSVKREFPGLSKSDNAIVKHYVAWRKNHPVLPGAQRPEVRKRKLEKKLTPQQQHAALAPQSPETAFMMSGVPGTKEQREYKQAVEQTSYQPTEMSSFDTLVNLLFMGAPVGKAGQAIASKTGKLGKTVQGLGEAAAKIPGAKGIGARAGYRAVTGAAEFTALQPIFSVPTLAKEGPKAYVDQMLDGLQQANINNPMILGAVLKTVPPTILEVLGSRIKGTPIKPGEVKAAKEVYKAVKAYVKTAEVKPVTPQKAAPVAPTQPVAPKATTTTPEPVKGVGAKMEAKEPWMMTRVEFDSAMNGTQRQQLIDSISKQAEEYSQLIPDSKNPYLKNVFMENTMHDVKNLHESAVQMAREQGKPVPSEVLADYPDLAAKYTPTAKLEPAGETVGQKTMPSFIASIEAEARERIAARRAQIPPDAGLKKGQRGAVYNPLDDITDYAIIGAAKIAKGTIKFKDWSVEMVKEFGEEIRPILNKVWKSAQDYHNKEISPVSKDIELFGGEADPRFKFVQALKSARESEPAKQLMFARTRSQRYGELSSAMEDKSISAAEARIKGLGALKGEFERPDFEIPNFSKADLSALMEMARTSDALHSHYERLDIMNAVADLVESGKQPEPRLYAKLAKVYGPEFARRLQNPDTSNWINASRRIWVEVGGLQRALQTGFEASWNLIQGWRMALMEPRQWAKGTASSTKAFFSEKNTKIMDEQVRNHPDYDLAYQAGLHLPEVGETTHPAYRDDPFVINSLRKIPGVSKVYEASERAFVTPGNVNRMGLFSKYAQLQRELNAGKEAPNWQQFVNRVSAATTGKVPFKPGKEYITMEEARQWARYTNVMSSRGFLLKGERAADVIGAPFYSLRNLAAQIEHPFYIFHPNKAIQSIAIRHWVQYAGLTAAILETAKLAGYEVETDPTSSDFGKIKLGNRRFDMLGGYGPLVRMIIRTREGNYKAATGKKIPTTGSKEFGQFLRFKASPIIGSVWNSIERKDAVGQPYDIKHWTNIMDDWAPMFATNIYDTWRLEGFDKTKWVAPYVFYGGRLQTYDANEGKGKKKSKSKTPTQASLRRSLRIKL